MHQSNCEIYTHSSCLRWGSGEIVYGSNVCSDGPTYDTRVISQPARSRLIRLAMQPASLNFPTM